MQVHPQPKRPRANLLTRLQHPAMLFNPIAPADAAIGAIRDARFAEGVYCPRCQSTAVHRFGRFAGRQRYRCRGCKRTFSDLTGTSASYIKKLNLWVDYALGMANSLTLRRSAALLGTTPSTTFRWRHRILGSLCAGDALIALTGWIELDETGFAYSEKGRRDLSRLPRPRGVWQDLRTRWKHPRVSVPIAFDRAGMVVSGLVYSEHTRFADLTTQILPHVRAPATMLLTDGPLSRACAAQLRRLHPTYTVPRFGRASGPPLLHHTNSARSYIRRFRVWLLRFRGVATRYLSNYLAWHCLLDAVDEGVTGALYFRRMNPPRRLAGAPVALGP